MQVGPFELQAWHLILLGMLAVVLVWFLISFLVSVTGTWERVDEDGKPGRAERITLVQFGPMVRGRRMMKGGFQEYSGIIRGRSLALTRRDHGAGLISSQGFPETIVPEIDGTIIARMRLTLSADGQVIFGTFTPQKIEFTHEPPQITSRRFLEPSFRRYRLISRTPIETEVTESGVKSEEQRASRRTV